MVVVWCFCSGSLFSLLMIWCFVGECENLMNVVVFFCGVFWVMNVKFLVKG